MTAEPDETAAPRGAQDDTAMPTAPPPKGPTRYRIYVDRGTVDGMRGSGEVEMDDVFPELGLGVDDLLFVAEQEGHTREAAVGAILDRDMPSDARLQCVQAAEQAGVALDFTLAPLNYLGTVPVATEVKRNRKVGR